MNMLANLFGGANKNQQQQQTQQQQQPQNPHVAGNPTVPSGQEPGANPNPKTEATVSPTDKFKDLWQTDPNAQSNNNQPNFKLNPEQLQNVTGKMDFTKSLKQEDMAAIAQGGEGAVAALGNILNSFGRELFGANAQFASHLTETGYNSASKIIDQGLPGVVRSQMTAQQLYASNPKLKDPALQPLVGALQGQFSAKHPNASPQEINDMVSEYFTTVVGGAFAKPEDTSAKDKYNQAADFSSFLG